MTSVQRQAVNNGHYFWVPRVVVVHKFDCTCIWIDFEYQRTRGSCLLDHPPEKSHSNRKLLFGCLGAYLKLSELGMDRKKVSRDWVQ